MYDARTIANNLIERGIKRGEAFTPLQIIKLVYFCHAWMLAFHGRPLVRDEQRVLAWKDGPVISDLYYDLKKWGRSPVQNIIRGDRQENLDRDAGKMIDIIFDNYGDYTGSKLWKMAHMEGGPWHQVWHDGGANLWDQKLPSAEIPNSLIEEYYRSLLEENRAR